MRKKIMVNQCGYTINDLKTVVFVSNQPVSYEVHKSAGDLVLRGEAVSRIHCHASGEENYRADFSEVTEPGVYYITAEGLGESDLFKVGSDVYDDVFLKSVKFFYLQRCGQKLTKEGAGLYAHDACHTEPARVHNSDKTMDVSGGWHDAGDYGRYTGPAAMSVAQLLLAYEVNGKLTSEYGDETVYEGKLPAFLEEIKYELDFMLKMQAEDGTLYHKVSCAGFCGHIDPSEEREELILSPVSVTATADFAAACAMAVKFYMPFDEEYAGKLEQGARKAYEALSGMDIPGGFKNPGGITTGEYGDDEDADERYWAAAEMYKAFGDEKYRADFEKYAQESIYQGYGWADMGSYGNIAYITTEYPTDKELMDKIKGEMIKRADELLTVSGKDGYGTALRDNEYVWGSNLVVACNGTQLYDAYVLTGESKYLNAAWEQLHYLLGKNPMGLCYVTGCGTDAVKRPHHRPSVHVGKAMPGMLSGGPCRWLADEVAKQVLAEAAPAKCFADMLGSYSTNEVTIYWNSAFILLLAQLYRK